MRASPLPCLRRAALAATATLLWLAACARPAAAPPGSVSPTRAMDPAAGDRSAVRPGDPRMERFVDSVLAGLTTEEKLGQLTQYRGQWGLTGPQTPEAGVADIRAGRVGSFLGVVGAALTREMQRVAVEESRARIPLLFAHDVIHGFRTIFPVPLAQAASWDPPAIQRAARVGAAEGAANGLHWTFAPMVDIARDPRWGRVVEGAGEDPYLGSAVAAAAVRGIQGNDLRDSLSLIATAKHFVGYGAAEGGRDYNVAEIPERTLRETYLPPFHAAVNAGARSVMASFNEIDGIPMHVHGSLINGVLRERWGWDGILVSDYTGVMELLNHGVAADTATAGRKSLQAGVDVDMVSNIFYSALPGELRAGRLTMATVDEAVRRVLRVKYELGLFSDPYRHSSEARERALTLAPSFVAESREMARRSIVLLKNAGGMLPLRKSLGTLAVIGPLADDARSALGNWAALGRAEDAVTILAGIRQAVSAPTRVLYARGASVDDADTSGFADAVRVARQADAVVLVIGEEQDMSAESRNRASLDLPGVQLQLAQAVVATGKPVVAVLTNGRPLSIPWLDANVPAILETWYLGVQMGPAVADVLFGDVNPGGKLPITFPRTVGQVPIYYNHKNTGRPAVGDERYTSRYIDVPWTPLYPFGHGLSYTTFDYDAPALSASDLSMGDTLVVRVTVTNSGTRVGDEVVQLYLRDDAASVTRPVKMLRGFQRLSLQPGERRTLAFTLHPRDLAFYDLAMRHVVEPGTFTVYVGGSSEQVRDAHFRVTGATTVFPDRGFFP